MQTYLIRTFGCQMNKHDSERVAGMFDAQSMRRVDRPEDADVVVFMTCCVRENADERLRGQVASLKAIKTTGANPDVVIAVGGCIGQRDGELLLKQLPHVDVVFGTHNLANLPALVAAAKASGHPSVQVLEEGSEFASDLPSHREHPWHAWVPITVGCDNFCSYCVVPYVRGRERSRPLEAIVSEVEGLVADGVLEVTLLGQNVNSYGRDLYGEPRFAQVLSAVADTGVARIRFATSHPKDLSPQTIRALAELPAVMPYLHLPVQSGSNRVLEAMNRRYTREHYLGLVDAVREAVPGISLSTDVIVGFPGETDADFADTLDVIERVGFDQAFTFIYSPREGTPAASMSASVARDVSQVRLDALVEAVHRSALERSRALIGTTQPVLLEGASRRDATLLTGRTPTNKVVHAPIPAAATAAELAGRIVPIRITDAQTWFLLGSIEGTNL